MKFRKHAIALALAAGFALAGSASASMVMVDDFNFDQPGASIADTTHTPADGGNSAARGTGGNVLAGWNRTEIYADLVSGDRVSQADCANCQEGHFIQDPNSLGNGYEAWEGARTNFSKTTWYLDYGLDVAGLDVVLSLVDSTTNTIEEIWWKNIAATTPASGTPGTLSGSFGADVWADKIFIDEIGVGGIYNPDAHGLTNYKSVLGERDFGNASEFGDFNKDNLRYGVPEPTTLALLGLGLAGIGWQRRRKA